MKYFRYYLYERGFVLKTDHKALEAFNNKRYVDSPRAQRWLEKFQEFNLEVKYIPGESIPHVDVLNQMHTVCAVN
ncbi:hypothetical protein PAEPH01_2463 [Pancytospora epiphaga]|nr:hypothetical protein PAEPH01_2463 [Pancytospora epiphaga]